MKKIALLIILLITISCTTTGRRSETEESSKMAGYDIRLKSMCKVIAVSPCN